MVTEHVTASDPPLRFSGEALVRLDSQGFLRTFEAIPPQQDSSSESGPVTGLDSSFLRSGASAF